MPHFSTSPYAVAVFDLMHRPGEMREKTLEVVESVGYGNAVIGVKPGTTVRVDARLESLHDGVLVSADVQ